MSLLYFLVLISFLLGVVLGIGQNITSQLAINTKFSINIEEGKSKIYSITIGEQISQFFNLYLEIYTKDKDLLQIPYVLLKQGQYKQLCFNADLNFSGICKIPFEQLKLNRTFIIQIKCLTFCELICETYLSRYPKLQLQQSLQLRKTEQIFQIIVPQKYTNSTIIFQAMILNIQQNIEIGEDGLDLYLRYDSSQNSNSSDFNDSIRAISLNGIGKQIILPPSNISLSNTLKLFILIKDKLKIRLNFYVKDISSINIELGKNYLQFAINQSKIYCFDANKFNLIAENLTIQLQLSIFSGDPYFYISFDMNQTNKIILNKSSTVNSFSITPSILLIYNYTGFIYLHTTSKGQSQYQFRFRVLKQAVTLIQPYLSYYEQLKHKQIRNHILIQDLSAQESSDNLISYSIKVDVVEGIGKFYVKKCKQMELGINQNPSFQSCLAREQQITSVTNNSLINNTIQSQNHMTVIFSFDTHQCNNQSSSQYVRCGFIIISQNDGEGLFKYSMMVQRRHLISYLQQDKIVKQYLYEQNYAFYSFSLPSIESIKEINIFITTLSGQTALVASTRKQFPMFSDNSSEVFKQLGSNGNILIKQKDLAKDLYISVFAYKYSQICLGVTVIRKTQNNSIHQLPLLQGTSQTYNLDDEQAAVNFRMSPSKQSNIKLIINEITGAIDYAVEGQDQIEVNCKNNNSNRLSCNFYSNNNQFFIIRVNISNNQASKFSIFYSTEDNSCIISALNEPIYLHILPNSSICYYFNINRQMNIFYSSSQSHLQLFQHQIDKNLSINGNNLKDTDTNHRIIEVSQLESYCQNIGGKTCRIQIAFRNIMSNTSYMNFIMSEEDSQIALYDGISQRINEIFISPQISNFFYFPVRSLNSIELYLTSHTPDQSYYLSSQIISKQIFINVNDNHRSVYPGYVEQQHQQTQKMSNKSKILAFIFGRSQYFKIQTIQSQTIQFYCPQMDCYLVTSIYSQYYQQIEFEEINFEIQISQQETYLHLGDSKIGMLNREQLYTYLVDPTDAIIQFQQINSESKGLICLKAAATTANGTIVKRNQLRNNIIIKKQDNIERIIVKGQKNRCTFSIKYLQVGNIVQSARLSHPYQIIIKDKNVYSFLQYHNSNNSFRVIQLATLGSASIFAFPVRYNNITISELLQLNYSQYPTFPQNEVQLLIEPDNQNFCSSCYYFIAITSDSDFIGQIIFLREKDPIPLTVHHILKEWLQLQTVFAKQTYVYYSVNSFIINFNLLLGNISVVIINPSGNTEVSKQIYKQQTFFIQSPSSDSLIGQQFYSDDAKYIIEVQTLTKQAEFYVQVRKSELTTRIFQGYPCEIYIDEIMAPSIQFTNSKNTTQPLELIIITQQSQDILLDFTITGQTVEKKLLSSSKLLKGIVKSQNTYSITLNSMQGRYFVAIKPSQSTNISALLTKYDLSYIAPYRTYFFTAETILQIKSQSRKIIMQIFTCSGQVQIKGYKNYEDISMNNSSARNQLIIERHGHSCHQILTIQHLIFSYYIQIQNKNKAHALQYQISYQYFDQQNPYDFINIQSYDVEYKIINGDLKLQINPPQLNNQYPSLKANINSVKYTAYASNNKMDIMRYSRCSIKGNIVEVSTDNFNNLILNKSSLSKLLKQNQKQFFVSAEVEILISFSNVSEPNHNSQNRLHLFYRNIQLLVQSFKDPEDTEKSTQSLNLNNYILATIALTLGITLLIAVFISLVKKIRNLRDKSKRLTQQGEAIPSTTNIPSQNIITLSQNQPQTGDHMVKQQI